MMQSEILRHFSKQLHAWCHDRITQKPSPFCQVELHPDLLGTDDRQAQSVVLWVNRESCLAGALVLLPPNHEEEIFPEATATATALGLDMFYTWGRYEISAWSSEYDPPEKIWEYDISLEERSSAAFFQKALNRLIDQIEKNFFEQQSQEPLVNHLYLANLLHLTYLDLLPSFQSGLQEINADRDGQLTTREVQNLLLRTLLLPPALACDNLLSLPSSPEKLESSLVSDLERLPDDLRDGFSSRLGLTIPPGCRRRFNHYVRRIRQLAPHLPDILAQTTQLLLERWAEALGGFRGPDSDAETNYVLVNCADYDLGLPVDIEIAPAGILAARALIFDLAGPDRRTAPKRYKTPFSLSERIDGRLIYGVLDDDHPPSATELKNFKAALRFSWPNRRLKMTGKTPLWGWQLLHLCGLVGHDCRLELGLPSDWLRQPFGAAILSTLQDKIHLREIEVESSGRVLCKFQTDSDDADAIVSYSNETRRPVPSEPQWSFGRRLLAGQVMPEPIFKLFNSDQIRFFSPEEMQEFPVDGILNFFESSFGQTLWRLLNEKKLPTDRTKRLAEINKYPTPLPSVEVLTTLANLRPQKGQIQPAAVDQELEVWLGPLPEVKATSAKKTAPKEKKTSDTVDELTDWIKKEEIPLFPDDFLFNIPEADQTTYSFAGQLKIIDTFFNQVVLTDQNQKEISVEGTSQAEALVLLSSYRSGKVSLPQDEAETIVILERYLEQLRTLQKRLLQHATTTWPDKKAAPLVRTVWNKFPVPDYDQLFRR